MMGREPSHIQWSCGRWLESGVLVDELTHVNVVYMYLGSPTRISGLSFRRENKELIENASGQNRG
ncbi:MAG: hypothetical protein QXL15_00105 [Candidatus Korarchaeota archaeon]